MAEHDTPAESAHPEGTAEPSPDAEVAAAPHKRRRWRRVLGWTAGSLAVLLAATGIAGYVIYQRLEGNVQREHVGDRLGPNRPDKLNKSMNILLIGSDSRAGENSQYGTTGGERSDTTILLHLSPNRDRAIAISFPRDSMVQIPECRKPDGGTVPARFGQINTAFAYAGATCTWRTIESLTNIHIDHYVKIDFAGFKRVVDALGGVEICVPQPINDPKAKLNLKAGRQTVMGDQALGYVRARYSLGNGSDLERIQRQQKFMAAVVNKATSTGMLTNPGRSYSFLDAATKSISTDDGFTLSLMRRLANSLKGISAGTVRFLTVPTQTYPRDPNRVQWNMPQARPLFEAIRQDTSMPASSSPSPKPSSGKSPAGKSSATKGPLPKPSTVRVTVVGPARLTAPVVAQLKAHGFVVPKTTEQGETATTQIRYGSGASRRAAALAALVPDTTPTADSAATSGMVYLYVGQDGVRLDDVAIPKVSGEVSAKQNPCKT